MKNSVLVLILPCYCSINPANVASSEWSSALVRSLQCSDKLDKIYLLSPQLFKGSNKTLDIKNFCNIANNPFRKTKKLIPISIPTINVPGLRKLLNIISLFLFLLWICAINPRKKLKVLTYNTYIDVYTPPTYLLRMGFNLELCPIILDLDDPSVDNWSEFINSTEQCSKIIFLSQWSFDNYPGSKPKHLFIGTLT